MSTSVPTLSTGTHFTTGWFSIHIIGGSDGRARRRFRVRSPVRSHWERRESTAQAPLYRTLGDKCRITEHKLTFLIDFRQPSPPSGSGFPQVSYRLIFDPYYFTLEFAWFLWRSTVNVWLILQKLWVSMGTGWSFKLFVSNFESIWASYYQFSDFYWKYNLLL